MHTLIIGMTESGKTTLGKKMVAHYRARGVASAVLDPLSDPGWQADYVTKNRQEFLTTVKQSRSLAVFVDEAGESVGQYEYEMHWLATRGRHYGHACHFLAQRAQQIAKTVRDQCSVAYIFACSRSDAKMLADEYNDEVLAQCNRLKKGEFFRVGRFDEAKKYRIDFSTMTVIEVTE